MNECESVIIIIVLHMLCYWINLILLSLINLDYLIEWIQEFCTDPTGIDFVYKFCVILNILQCCCATLKLYRLAICYSYPWALHFWHPRRDILFIFRDILWYELFFFNIVRLFFKKKVLCVVTYVYIFLFVSSCCTEAYWKFVLRSVLQ